MKLSNMRLSAFLIIFTLLACQDDQPINDQSIDIDQDMLDAIDLAEEHQNSIGGRSSNNPKSITILKYKDGELQFNTNTDNINGYTNVTETTITAYAEPGEFIYWYSGGGLTDLEDIDFDDDDEDFLDELPDEYKADKMWVLRIPEDYDPANGHLKYDIVYESKDNEGIYIRLDPKIQVQNWD